MAFDYIDRLVERLLRSLTEELGKAEQTKYVVEVGSEEEFNTTLSKSRYVVVCFYKPDCPACRRFMPVFETVSREFRQSVTFIKVNTVNLKSISKRFSVSVTPTTMVLLNGSEVARYEGSMNEVKLMMFLIASGLHPSRGGEDRSPAPKDRA